MRIVAVYFHATDCKADATICHKNIEWTEMRSNDSRFWPWPLAIKYINCRSIQVKLYCLMRTDRDSIYQREKPLFLPQSENKLESTSKACRTIAFVMLHTQIR